jgi:hypothetical protein
MEKAGGIFKNEGMVQKGQAKRAGAGNDAFQSGGNTDTYGSGNQGGGNNNY